MCESLQSQHGGICWEYRRVFLFGENYVGKLFFKKVSPHPFQKHYTEWIDRESADCLNKKIQYSGIAHDGSLREGAVTGDRNGPW